MKTFENPFKLLSKIIFVFLMVFGSYQAQAKGHYDEFIGVWTSINFGGSEETLELCLRETEALYKWKRTGETMIADTADIIVVDDVFIMPIYLDGEILRKIVLILRGSGTTLVGRIHMYSSGQAFNYWPLYLKRAVTECGVIETPIN